MARGNEGSGCPQKWRGVLCEERLWQLSEGLSSMGESRQRGQLFSEDCVWGVRLGFCEELSSGLGYLGASVFNSLAGEILGAIQASPSPFTGC